jgi:hypothetical protein
LSDFRASHMLSTPSSRAADAGSRPFWRRLLGLAPLLILGSVIAGLWFRLDRQEAELRQTRLELASASKAERREPVLSLALARELENNAREQRSRPPVAPTPNAGPPSEVVPPSERDEPSTEERAQLRRARFDHIERIFVGQTPSDFQPERARSLEGAVAPALSELTKSRAGLALGSVDCRGRMCGVEVGFDDVADVAALEQAMETAVRAPEIGAPLIHIVTRAGERGEKQNVGRLYFEWLPAAGP